MNETEKLLMSSIEALQAERQLRQEAEHELVMAKDLLKAVRRRAESAESIMHTYEHALNERDKALSVEHQLRQATEQRLTRRDIEYDAARRTALALERRLKKAKQHAEAAEVLEKELRGERDYWQRAADHEAKQGQKTRRDLIAERQECYALHAKIEIAEQRAERAEALAALVTPELAGLLERAGGDITYGPRGWASVEHFTSQDGGICLELAARIREVLDDSQA